MRTKIIIPNILIVLLLGGGMYGYLHTVSRSEARVKLHNQLQIVSTLFVRSEALRSYEQLQDVSRLAMSKSVSEVFDVLDLHKLDEESVDTYENRIRDAWFKKALTAVETSAVQLGEKGRAPSLVFITDRNGVVLARNTTPNACPAGKNVSNAMSVVKRALDGEAQYQIWSVSDSPLGTEEPHNGHLCALMNAGLLELSAAPIWGADDKVAGTIVVGYEVSNGMASQKAKDLGVELSVIHGNEVYSTSIETDAAREGLNRELHSPQAKQSLGQLFNGKRKAGDFRVVLQGREYLALAAAVPNAPVDDRIAFVFLGENLSSTFSGYIGMIIWGMIVLAAVSVFLIGMLLGNYFIRPVVEIEEGLLKIINGDFEYRFDVDSDEVGGLGYRINQLVNVLTEQEDVSDEE